MALIKRGARMRQFLPVPEKFVSFCSARRAATSAVCPVHEATRYAPQLVTGRRRAVALLAAAGAFAGGLLPLQSHADVPFDPSALDARDLRVIQAALTLTGDYNALLDGDWGRGSEGALSAYLGHANGNHRARLNDLVPLLRGFEQERRRSGWLMLHFPDLGASLAVPATLARSTPDTDPAWRGAVRWRSVDDSIDISLGILERTEMERLHETVRAGHASQEYQYVLRRADRWVTGQHAGDDSRVYMRSDQVSDGFVSVLARAAAEHEFRLALIASSFARGPVPELTPAPGGPLAALLESDAG